jgi:hypothetical protein
MTSEATTSLAPGGRELTEALSSDQNTYQLIPLWIQKKRDSYLVGSLELNRFYQLPDMAVYVIRLLQEGLSIPEVKARLAAEPNGDVDIDDFASTLIDIGFAYRGQPRGDSISPTARSRERFAAQVARVIFFWRSSCLYLSLVAWAIILGLVYVSRHTGYTSPS